MAKAKGKAMAAVKSTVKPSVAAPAKGPNKMALCRAVIAHEGNGRTMSDALRFVTSLAEVVGLELKQNGRVTIPGIVTVLTVEKPAVAEHIGVDPFTKAKRTFKARPATTKVKARPLKALRDAVAGHKGG